MKGKKNECMIHVTLVWVSVFVGLQKCIHLLSEKTVVRTGLDQTEPVSQTT